MAERMGALRLGAALFGAGYAEHLLMDVKVKPNSITPKFTDRVLRRVVNIYSNDHPGLTFEELLLIRDTFRNQFEHQIAHPNF